MTRGFWIAVTPGTGQSLAKDIITHGVWAPTETLLMHLLMSEHCRKEDSLSTAKVVVDVGANLGWFTLLARAAGL
ncbi:hypothetical protein T484DRAFT_1848663 [Baffinella frigidus]|nr:hypothetical protein T484DRAFT_1848663 [Cryptophyta sp. CCMP2293]